MLQHALLVVHCLRYIAGVEGKGEGVLVSVVMVMVVVSRGWVSCLTVSFRSDGASFWFDGVSFWSHGVGF